MSISSKQKATIVGEAMRRNFITIDGKDTIETALKKMDFVETKCLVVNKRSNDDEYGLLLISDIARKVLAKDKAPDRVNVYEIMAKPVLTVDINMKIKHCARLFTRFDISRAPVMEDGKVVGVISFTDLVLKGMVG